MGDNEKRIRIYVALKHMGNLTKKIKTYPFDLAKTPQTFRELVEESVRSCIASYKARAENANNPQPLSDEEWRGMQEIGKFAFGVHYNENDINEAKAVKTALDAVRDGIVRVFKGNDELIGLENELEISEGDVFTFVRLTMLSGRMW